MYFSEVFPKVKDSSDLSSVFKNVEVRKIMRSSKDATLDIYTSSSVDCLKKEDIRNMEVFIEKQLFEDLIKVRIDFLFQPPAKAANTAESSQNQG